MLGRKNKNLKEKKQWSIDKDEGFKNKMMYHRRRKGSLQKQLVVFVTLAFLFSILLFWFVEYFGDKILENTYLTEKKVEERESKIVTRFKFYVYNNKVESTDYVSIKSWCRRQKDIYFSIYDEGEILYETDGKTLNIYKDGNPDGKVYSKKNMYTIRFLDGNYKVSIEEFSEDFYYSGILIIGLLVSMVSMILSLLAFNQKIIKKVVFLSNATREVRNGDLEKEIIVDANDEIGRLGDDVNQMRISIINHYKKEQEAWQANKDLITSISHDIRTPLTSLIGYSEMMAYEEEENMEEIKEYAKICCEKAYRLKDMTDQLFRYFLVYGGDGAGSGVQRDMKKYQANMLLEQVIGEYTVGLSVKNYNVECYPLETECFLETDVMLLKRVFDNIFSNIEKYADKKKKIVVNAVIVENEIVISIKNTISKEVSKAESTRIGMKTCEKIMTILGGRFETKREAKDSRWYFTSICYIPFLWD